MNSHSSVLVFDPMAKQCFGWCGTEHHKDLREQARKHH